jgi:hypothetical protein
MSNRIPIDSLKCAAILRTDRLKFSTDWSPADAQRGRGGAAADRPGFQIRSYHQNRSSEAVFLGVYWSLP